MYILLDDLFNFKDGKQINFKRGLYWGLIIFFTAIAIINS